MPVQKNTPSTQNNTMKKVSLVIKILILCVLFALLVISILQYYRFFKTTKTKPMCTTPECIKASALILDYIDPSVDPCDDFYHFVCGNFLKKSIDSGQVTAVSDLENIVQNRLHAIVKESDNKAAPRALELQRRFYRNCLNTSTFEENTETLLDLVEKLGGWPVLKGRFWNEAKFDWIRSTVTARRLGFIHSSFIQITEAAEIAVTGKYIISISPPTIDVIPEEFREAYVQLMIDIGVDLGATQDLARSELTRMASFEKQLRSLIIASEEVDKLVTIQEITDQFPTIPWLEFLTNIINGERGSLTNATKINFKAGLYLESLQNLLSNTAKSTQANYVIWRIIDNLRNYLRESVQERFNTFFLTANPLLVMSQDRNPFCLEKAVFYFPSVASLAYVRKHLSYRERFDIKEMVHNIKQKMIAKIKASDWVEDEDKRLMELKLNEIQNYIGVTDFAYNEDFDRVVGFEQFHLESDNFMKTLTALQVKQENHDFSHTNHNFTKVARLLLETDPIMEINAYYLPQLNSFILPASFLQGVIYNFDRPSFLNYGSLGSIIGHELFHAITSQEEGPDGIKPSWSPKTTLGYQNKTNCLIEEYESYHKHLSGFVNNGTATLHENLSDWVGPNVALEAYQSWSRNFPEEERKLPGVDYSPEQLFWIMFGSYKCYQPKMRWSLDAIDAEHGVPSFAVGNSVRNSPSFASAFQCPPASPMNPAKKCSIL